ncbi:MAG TPA: DUF3134 domain-containing protein [Allocoleopsis sp.]
MFKNPALREEPRYDPAAVIPLQQEASILNWLEKKGRLMARDHSTNDEQLIDNDDDIGDIMGVDDALDYDDDFVLEPDELVADEDPL